MAPYQFSQGIQRCPIIDPSVLHIKRQNKVEGGKGGSIRFFVQFNEFVATIMQEYQELPSLENMLYKYFLDEGQEKLMLSLSIIAWMDSDFLENEKIKSSGVKKIFVLALYVATRKR